VKFLKRLLILVIVLAAGVYLYGRSLPREHVASSTVTLIAPADSVYRVLRNFGAHPTWWSDVKSSTRIDGKPRESWEENMGPAGLVRMEITREVVGRQFITTILNDTQQDWGGTWTYDIVTTGAGTEVTITESGWVETPFYRVGSKLMGKYRTIDSMLRSLANHFGEVATPRHG
jgi:hypothetical protein